MYQFQKKDGSIVEFDQNKIIVGIIKAGATPVEAQTIVANIITWLPTVIVDNVVKSSDIRSKVISELQSINPAAADSFQSYLKA